jgi:hypothetical protein
LHGAGVQPHTPGVPPPPHFCPTPLHVQFSAPPQPFGNFPHMPE